MKRCIFIIMLLAFAASCGKTHQAATILDSAEACLQMSPDSAFVALDSLDRSLLSTDELKARHALLYSIALEKIGIPFCNDSIINIAVDYYRDKGMEEELETALKYRDIVHGHALAEVQIDTLARQQQVIIAERYADKMLIAHRQKSDRMKTVTIAVTMVVLIVLVFFLTMLYRRLRRMPDKKAMEVISRRLAVLDSILASRMADNPAYEKLAEENIDGLISDRERFLESTRIVFAGTHPEFIRVLSDAGLTDWEAGYCCLYILGLRGKEVGEYIRKKRHYIIDHEIRKKLGLTEHDTNLSIYLRNLLSQTEGRA